MKLRTIYRLTPPVLGFLALANAAVSVVVFARVRKPVEYKVQVVEAPRLELPEPPPQVTNEVRRGLLPSGQRRETVLPQPALPDRWTMRYHWCIVNGRPLAVLNGVHVREGDLHAYGVVRSIYPERIYFEGGAYIDNVINERSVQYDGNNAAARPLP